MAASQLFVAAALEYLKVEPLDIERFRANLDTIGDWVVQKYPIKQDLLDQMKNEVLAVAHDKKAAKVEADERSRATITANPPLTARTFSISKEPQAGLRRGDDSEVYSAAPRAWVEKANFETSGSGPYSDHDNKVFKLIGKQEFEKYSNEGIATRNRRLLVELWGNNGPTPNALRSCLNRIRRHHHLPKSQEIK
jgi:hypothetical protein